MPKNSVTMFLSTAQAADHLGMTARNVRYLLETGKLPGERQQTARGPIWTTTLAAVQEYQAAHAEKPKPKQKARSRSKRP